MLKKGRLMNSSTRIVLSVATALVVLGVILFVVSNTEFVMALSALPIFIGLVTALWVLIRDLLAHERELRLQDAKNSFFVGASSHMANVAFDKFALFAERYSAESYRALDTLFREGPTSEAIKHSHTLNGLRRDFTIWLTEEIDQRLNEFEVALGKIGTWAHYESKNSGTTSQQDQIDKMYEEFAGVLGFEEWDDKSMTDHNAVETIMKWIRGILGTEELMNLRRTIVKTAEKQVR